MHHRVSVRRYLFSVLLCQTALFYAVRASTPVEMTLREIGTLPDAVSEVSGMLIDLTGGIWLLNDSGDGPLLYQTDTLSWRIVRTIRVLNATNIDWEDLASDRRGSIFVGDFGNNDNTRRDLVIYRLPDPSLISGDTVSAEIISFSYPDQQAFPPPPSQRMFDMEAFVHWGDSLYLFSKNRTVPFDGYTRQYSVPDRPGTWTASLCDSFRTTTQDSMFLYWITAAAIAPRGDRLALLTSDKIWVFSEFSGTRFFSGSVTGYHFNHNTQKESIEFVDSLNLLIADEYNPDPTLSGSGQRLYHVQLPDQPVVRRRPAQYRPVLVPATDDFTCVQRLFDCTGRIVGTRYVQPGSNQRFNSFPGVGAGVYLMKTPGAQQPSPERIWLR